jgi:hypothetical protein
LAYDLRKSGTLGFSGNGVRTTLHSEVGVITRGLGIASLRVALPMSALDGQLAEQVRSATDAKFVEVERARISPVVISAMLGVMF